MNIDEILQDVRRLPFSRRRKFVSALNSMRIRKLTNGDPVTVAWPDALLIFTDEEWQQAYQEAINGFTRISRSDCEAGFHSWVYTNGKLPPDTKCTTCGELYGDVR